MCFRVQSLTVTMCLLLQPLSEKAKNYVLKLDIDADINILKEKLNICQEAVDYFRSSSKLLQEGVKAGLTLYDIAIMCCRNDDLGEIPSKLEILSNMAAELATTAVENGRWHHTAAVNAIAEQLSPARGQQGFVIERRRIFRQAQDGGLRKVGVAVGLHDTSSPLK